MTDRYWIAVDMDGTLLNSRGQISERTCAVLQKCLDQGHHVLPATKQKSVYQYQLDNVGKPNLFRRKEIHQGDKA